MVGLLQALAKLLDKLVPGEGARHIVAALLTIIGGVAWFLTGKVSAQEASLAVTSALGVLFAAIHKQPPIAPS